MALHSQNGWDEASWKNIRICTWLSLVPGSTNVALEDLRGVKDWVHMKTAKMM